MLPNTDTNANTNVDSEQAFKLHSNANNKNEALLFSRTSFTLAQSSYYILLTFFAFFLFNLTVTKLMYSFTRLGAHPNFWRIKNVFISWIHSIIASTFVVLNIYYTPELFTDMINVSSKLSYISISVSMGYFLYDAVDILASNKKLTTQSHEVLVHHALIIFIFCVPLSINYFVGYTIGALSIEFNTILLHLRFMIAFNPENRSTLLFRIVSVLNLVTFLVFRIVTLCWMTRWIVLNRKLVHVGWFTVGSVGLAIMLVINILLLQRLLQADFANSKKSNTNNNMKTQTSGSSDNEMPLNKGHHLD